MEIVWAVHYQIWGKFWKFLFRTHIWVKCYKNVKNFHVGPIYSPKRCRYAPKWVKIDSKKKKKRKREEEKDKEKDEEKTKKEEKEKKKEKKGKEQEKSSVKFLF